MKTRHLILSIALAALFALPVGAAPAPLANAAVTEGKAGSAPKLAVHAKAALDHSLAASLVAKSVSKNHIDAASKSLQQAIDHAALSHVQPATKASEEAVTHLSAAKK